MYISYTFKNMPCPGEMFPVGSNRPEQKCLPEPELNRNYITKY